MIGRAAERACAALRGQVDVVHIHTPFMAHRIGIKAARGLGLPTVETYHTFFEEYFHHYLPLLPRGRYAASRGRSLAGNATPWTP